MSTTSYYLYQKYISVDGGEPTPAYPAEYSYDGEGTMPPVVKEQYDTECGQVDTYRWVDTDDFICEETYSSQYLTIESLENGNTIKWKNGNGNFSKTISASTDNGATWTEYTATTGGTPIATLNAGDKVLLKGLNERYFPVNSGTYGFQDGNGFVASKNFIVYGNIMSLVSGDTFESATTVSSWAFSNIFYQSNKLISAGNLVLPATTLTERCYQDMFNNCSSLTTAPALPATTLTDYCYRAMFMDCTSLTTAPELPATTLGYGSYASMFDSCTSLTVAPTLPATTLNTWCYAYMFAGCTSLTSAPELPATALTNYCYQDMFNGCTSLTNPPVLSATTLADQCYRAMFSNCTSLTTAPELPATTLATYCYFYMFDGCTSLTSAPALPATTLASGCYNSMFNGCANLTTAPNLPATTLTQSCYRFIFRNCSSLNEITCLATNISASNCTDGWVSGVSATGTFIKSSSMNNWTRGSSGIPNNWTVQDA